MIVKGSQEVQWGALIGAVAAACFAPVIIRVTQRRWDPFEPIMILSAGVFVLFVLRPIWMWVNADWTVAVFDARAGFTGALGIAALGMVVIVTTYFLPAGARLATRIPTIRDDWDASRIRFAAGLTFVLAFVLFSFHVGTEGGFSAITNYFSGRSQGDFSLQESAGGARISSSYFALAPHLIVPIALALVVLWRRERSLSSAVLAIGSVALVMILTIPRGDRTFTLALLFPLLAFPYLVRGRRPRTVSVIASILVAVLIAGVLAEFRRQETRDKSLPAATVEAFKNPAQEFDAFMLSADVSMVYFLAAEYDAIPDRIQYKPAQGIATIAALPIPGKLWAGKPEEPAKGVYDELYRTLSANNRSGFAVSMFGSFYADSGWIGVVLYSMLYGILFRALFEYWRQRKSNAGVTMVYAAALPLVIMMLRTSAALAVGGAFILVIPLIVILVWAGRGVRGSPAGVPAGSAA